ncbi:MAG: phosphofructokinase, partial [Erysipelothrix sp.]|nr:phosphofructokinase [Erysipelothrix sp.]
GVKRISNDPYDVDFIAVEASKVANHVKNFPVEWILDDYAGVSEEAHAYINPLLVGTPQIRYDEKGLPLYTHPFYLNK